MILTVVADGGHAERHPDPATSSRCARAMAALVRTGQTEAAVDGLAPA